MSPARAIDARSAAARPADPGAEGGRVDDLRASYRHLKEGAFDRIDARSRAHAERGDVEHAMLLGLALGMGGDVAESSRHLASVAAARRDIVHPVDDLGRLLRERDREREILAHAAAAARLRPDDPRALVSHGGALIVEGRAAEAESVLRRAERLDPLAPNLMNQLGIALTELGRYGEALACFRDEAARKPENNIAWTNLACTLATEGQFDEALAFYRRSITLKPDNPSIRLNHAICLLKAGRTAQGWSEYEWRLKLPGHTSLPYERILPNLDDTTRLDGQVVLVTQEEGLGDTLQFARFLAPLRDRGASVLAWVPPPLETLLRNIGGIEVRSGETEAVAFGWHCPFLSLPRAFSATVDALPTAPYLSVRPERIEAMQAHLPPEDGRLRVGLVWGGSPRPENRQANAVDRRRSMGIAPLAAVADLDELCLVSLQLGPYRDQRAACPPGLALNDPMDASRDMEDTGALIAGLDIVVSVDTSVVHLAAGMGKPVLLLDRYDNCWRWLHGRDHNPYYPSLRIIRQTRAGDWTDVMARTSGVLRAMAAAKRAGDPPSLDRAFDESARSRVPNRGSNGLPGR